MNSSHAAFAKSKSPSKIGHKTGFSGQEALVSRSRRDPEGEMIKHRRNALYHLKHGRQTQAEGLLRKITELAVKNSLFDAGFGILEEFSGKLNVMDLQKKIAIAKAKAEILKLPGREILGKEVIASIDRDLADSELRSHNDRQSLDIMRSVGYVRGVSDFLSQPEIEEIASCLVFKLFFSGKGDVRAAREKAKRIANSYAPILPVEKTAITAIEIARKLRKPKKTGASQIEAAGEPQFPKPMAKMPPVKNFIQWAAVARENGKVELEIRLLESAKGIYERDLGKAQEKEIKDIDEIWHIMSRIADIEHRLWRARAELILQKIREGKSEEADSLSEKYGIKSWKEKEGNGIKA